MILIMFWYNLSFQYMQIVLNNVRVTMYIYTYVCIYPHHLKYISFLYAEKVQYSVQTQAQWRGLVVLQPPAQEFNSS